MKKNPLILRAMSHYLPGLLVVVTGPVSLYVNRLEAQNYTPPNSMWRIEILFIVFLVALSAVLYAVTKDHAASGITAVLLSSGLLLAVDVFLEFAICIVIALAAIALLTRRMTFQQVETAVMLSSVILFGYYAVLYAGYVIDGAKWDKDNNLLTPIRDDYRSAAMGNTPDIYYIILDGYGSEAMLREVHGIDNSQFIHELEARGFVVPPESRSNYPRTILSLASSLNMQYLDPVSEVMQDSQVWWPLAGTIMDNETIKYLKANGYSIANTASNWDYTTLPDADYRFNPFSVYLNKFEEYQIQQTNLSFLTSMDSPAISLPTYSNHRTTVLFAFDSLGKIASLPSPKFSLVHIISPHPPFIFDAEGNERIPDYPFTLSDARYLLYPVPEYRQEYADQMDFINQKVLEAVDAILANSATPPVIIIQGDHGPGIFTNYTSIEETCLLERFSILNAYYLPGYSDRDIPDDITPVNTFRLLFNLYFFEELPLLPDIQYFPKEGATYQFVDVSKKIQPSCEVNQE